MSAGCLSYDGATYYFQTVASEGDGRLYAINTADGTLKWSFATQSTGWDFVASSPIVTRDGVVIVGNNDGDTYFAIRDAGDRGELVDSLAVDAAGWARASATLSRDGLLYLPLRTVQIVGPAAGSCRRTRSRTCSRRWTCRPARRCRCTRPAASGRGAEPCRALELATRCPFRRTISTITPSIASRRRSRRSPA